MKRRQLLAGLLAGVALPGGVFAQTAEDQVVNQLKRQGYQRITLGRTLLGRTRIVATGPRGRREIVLNPSTGAILRDYVDRSDRGRDSDDRDSDDDRDDDDRDDDDDDRDDDDNSGRRGGEDRGRDDDRDDDDNSGGDDDDDDDDD
ncbi:hypothetical protein [Marivita sp.]|uniref:hypothetical protein n=1 Tax=Marivita sp. TaxID=2003365 RepID=UPI003F70C6B3